LFGVCGTSSSTEIIATVFQSWENLDVAVLPLRVVPPIGAERRKGRRERKASTGVHRHHQVPLLVVEDLA